MYLYCNNHNYDNKHVISGGTSGSFIFAGKWRAGVVHLSMCNVYFAAEGLQWKLGLWIATVDP